MPVSGYPGKKRVGVGGGATKEYVDFTSSKSITDHKNAVDPHPQYATDTEIPRFVTFWKWS